MKYTQDSIGFSFQSVSSMLARHSDNVLQANLNLSYSQYKVMTVLSNILSAKQVDIAEHLSQTEASISRQIKQMQHEKLIEVKVNPANRREHLVSMTAKGSRIYSKATDLLNRVYWPVFRNLNDSELRNMQNSLQILSNYLSK
ncbi:MarR family transcriptional regulator [Candidatus Saccharibacteria bacterium]|nr:MarR family transcriptional regulator [Candidatus Saccharibacteria bacterium]